MTATELRQWRDRMGLTQVELQDRLPAGKTTVAQWERGARRIPRFLARALRDLERELESQRTPAE